MAIVPRTEDGICDFFETRLRYWKNERELLGLTPERILQLEHEIANARMLRNKALEIRQAAKAATAELWIALEQLGKTGSACISTIRTTAALSDEPRDVLSAALIPPIRPKSKRPKPEKASILSASITHFGAVALKWKGTTAHGTFYTVLRKLAGETNYTVLGSVSAKSFTDAAIPIGTSIAVYTLIAHRGKHRSEPSAPTAVSFASLSQPKSAPAVAEKTA